MTEADLNRMPWVEPTSSEVEVSLNNLARIATRNLTNNEERTPLIKEDMAIAIKAAIENVSRTWGY